MVVLLWYRWFCISDSDAAVVQVVLLWYRRLLYWLRYFGNDGVALLCCPSGRNWGSVRRICVEFPATVDLRRATLCYFSFTVGLHSPATPSNHSPGRVGVPWECSLFSVLRFLTEQTSQRSHDLTAARPCVPTSHTTHITYPLSHVMMPYMASV